MKRKYDYLGEKKTTSIRISEYERLKIKQYKFKNLQHFIQVALKNVDYLANKGDHKIYKKRTLDGG
jgi:hypothetical protein